MKKIALFFIYLLIFLLNSKTADSVTYFEDNFNSYSDGEFPNKWVNYNSSCNVDWYVEDGLLKIAIAQHPCSENILPNAQNWKDLTEYVLDFDIIFKSGVDSHVYYRINPSANFIRLVHFTYPNGFIVDKGFGSEGFYRGYSPNIVYHYQYVVTPNNLKIYESNEIYQVPYLIGDINFDSNLMPGFIGLGSAPGSGTLTETWFDNFKVTSIDDNNESILNVPTLKQTDAPWGDDIYDSANLWSSNNQTISEWGCAVTSAAMVFNYHGLKKMENGLELDPGSLNEWLKSQPDGYVRNGLLNWISLSRLSRKIARQNQVSFDSLEYFRSGPDNSLLTSNLESGMPTILEVPGHFVVAKGVDDGSSSYFINDPYYSVTTLSDSQYNNSYLGMRTFTPANSDLSYLMFIINEDFDINLYDETNNPVGYVVIEKPITDPSESSENTSGLIKSLYFAKPQDGIYKLVISSQDGGSYMLDQYFYDIKGEVNVQSLSDAISDGSTHTYIISFDKKDSNNTTSELVKEITFETIKEDIEEAYKELKLGFGLKTALLALLNNAEKSNKSEISQKMLDQIIHLISKEKKISLDFAQELIKDVDILKENL